MKIVRQIRNIKISIYFAIALVIVAIIVLYMLLNRSYLAVTVTPANAVVTVDNRPIYLSIKGRGKITLVPGTYTLKIEADGFISEISQVKLGRAGSKRITTTLKESPKPYQVASEENVANNVQFISEADDYNAIFYFADNASTLYRAKFKEGDEDKIETVYNRPISNPPITGVNNIIWSPKKDAAILKKEDGVYYFDFQKYNFVSQEEIKFGDYIGDIVWSPDDSKIAYYYSPPNGERSLIFANRTNSQTTRVADLAEEGISNPYLSWSPDSEWLIVIPRNKDYKSNKIYLFNAYTRSFKELTNNGNHLEAKFSPDGSKILFSTYAQEPQNPVRATLSIMDKNGDKNESIDVFGYAGKTTWLNGSNSEIIVATYDRDRGTESIFGYNIETKEKSDFLMLLEKNSYVREINISANNNLLYYIASEQFYVVTLD